MNSPDLPDFDAWLGKRRVQDEVLSLGQARRLAATLDLDPEPLTDGGALPAGWHWIYFNPSPARSALGPEGHDAQGDFLPPIALPRRMWAGGTLRFSGTLRIGEPAERVSTVRSIEHKEGRSGKLVFVTVHHRIAHEDGASVDEEQNLVFLPERPAGAASAASPGQAPVAPEWSEAFTADEVTLFRFSALTFNSHRIHYDQRYVTEVEGYPGVVVHGPLLAVLLLGAGIRHTPGNGTPTGMPRTFRYRAKQPLFCNEQFQLSGGRMDAGSGAMGTEPDGGVMKLWAEHPTRGIAMEAELESAVTLPI